MAKSWSHADVVALIAQLLASGGKIDNQYMADVTGKSTPVGFQHKMRTVIRHAKLVVEDRAKGGKGLLSSVVGEGEIPTDPVAATQPAKGKRKGGAGAGVETVETVLDMPKPSKRGKVKDAGGTDKTSRGKKHDSPVLGDGEETKVKAEASESDVTSAINELAMELGTDYDGFTF